MLVATINIYFASFHELDTHSFKNRKNPVNAVLHNGFDIGTEVCDAKNASKSTAEPTMWTCYLQNPEKNLCPCANKSQACVLQGREVCI